LIHHLYRQVCNQVTPNYNLTFAIGTLDKYIKNVLGNDSSFTLPDILRPGMMSESVDSKQEVPQQRPLIATVSEASPPPSAIPPQSTPAFAQLTPQASISNEVATINNNNIPSPPESSVTSANMGTISTDLVPSKAQQFVDITEYLVLPQSDAAKKLTIPASTLSKRWKEAVRKRKWPYRMVCKIDKEIMTLRKFIHFYNALIIKYS
jgi:hypothetical protein